MPKFPGFIGPTYQDRSPRADAEHCINWYPSRLESGAGVNTYTYHATPGLALFADTEDGGPIRGISNFIVQGVYFYVVSGTEVYKVNAATGAVGASLGTIADDAAHSAVPMELNGTQVFLVSAGTPYLIDIVTDLFVPIVGLTGSFRGAIFLDGYFLTFEIGTQIFHVSDLYEGSNWDPLEVASAEAYPDGLNSILQDHAELWLFGDPTTEVWYDAGEEDFLFRRIPGAIIIQGCFAPASPVAMDNAVFWMGSSVWRARGYIPERISTHALEFAMQHYAATDDAIGFQYKEEGHWFYVLYFPTADVTWAYDAATGMWHERQSFVDGAQGAWLIRAMMSSQLIGGSRVDGKLYRVSSTHLDEDGVAITRERVAPHLNEQKNWVFYPRFGLNVETGKGQLAITEGSITGDPLTSIITWTGVKVDYRGVSYTITNGSTTDAYIYWELSAPTVFSDSPTLPALGLNDVLIGQNNAGVYASLWETTQAMYYLSYSDDGGNTWSTPIGKTSGARGDYKRLVRWNNLGRSRDRIFKVTFASPTEASMIDAYVGMTAGTDGRE